jgi:hypothetical protein
MTSRFAPTAAVVTLLILAFACLGPALYSIGPQKVTACDLMTSPAAYNHREIEVTGFVSHGFEDFTLFDPNCRSYPPVWLEYGGRVSSGTMY